MTLSDDDDEPMQQQTRRGDISSTAALTAEQKKAQRQQANKLAGTAAASAAAPAAPAKTLAQQLADAERDGDADAAADESDDEEFEMVSSKSAKSKSKAAPAPAKKGNNKAQKRKAAAAELDAAEDQDDDDDDDAAASFAWDADASLAPVSSSIAPPSKMFEPFVANAGTSLQHKIDKQIAQKKKKAEANAAKASKGKGKAAKKGSDDDSSEDDVDSEGSDSDDDDDDEADAAAADADEVDSDVDMHAYKDDEVRRKVPASNGPKIITATTLPKSANPIGDFASLKLSRPLLRAVSDLGWAAPTPVQAASIMPAVAGKDLLVNAVTGSGKTGAFMLPILERLLYRPKRVPLSRVLVLLPTRELAAQCHEVSSYLCKYTDIRICLVVGGLSEKVQEQELRNKPDIILATPGRLIDHLRNSANVHLEDIEILVLDEADRLLECGFAEELREIIRECPKGRQTLLFSATLTDHVVDLVNLSLNEPVRIKIDAYESIVDNLQQEFIRIRDTGSGSGSTRRGEEKSDKESDRDREAIILSLVKRSFKSKTIIFLQSKIQCHRMSIIFGLAQLKAAELQGNMTQTQRLESLEAFREGKVDFLLCTDLAARGLDIAGVETVLNMSMPRELRQYIHRVGRTARAGRSGRAVTLVGEGQRAALKELVKKAKDVVHSRVVAPDVIAKYRGVIREMEPDIRGVFDQEAEEKAARVAEMEANKLSNTMRFSEEIHARPAKTWFQTPAEKARAKESSARVFGDDDRDMERDEGEEGDLKSQARRAAKSEVPTEKPLTPKQLARAEAKLAKEKEKDKLRGLSRTKKRRRMMEMEAKEMANQARKEALAHAPDSLRGQSLAPQALPPSFEQQQTMQRLAGAKAKKAQRAEKAAELGIADIKEKRREQQAIIALRMEKKKGRSTYNDGSMESAHDDDGGSGGSSKKKPTSIKGSIFRYKDRTGSGDDRFKMPHRKFKEDQQQRAKGEASAAAGASGEKKKSGSTKGSASFKSKSKFKRR